MAKKKTSDNEKIFTKSFILLCVSRFFWFCVFFMFTAVIASYCFSYYQCDDATAGFAVGIYIIFGLISRFFAGHYTDIVGRRKMLLISGGVFLVATALYMIEMPFWLFVVVRAIHGFSFGFHSNTSSVIAVSLLPRSRMGEGLGYFALATTVASAVGPLLGLYLMQTVSFMAMYIASSLAAVLGLVAAVFVDVPDVEISPEERERLMKSFSLKDTFERRAVAITLIGALSAMLVAAANSFIETYAESIGGSAYVTGFFAIGVFIQLATRPIAGRLFDRKGPRYIIYPAILSLIIGFLLLFFAPHAPWMIALAGGLICFGYGTNTGNFQTLCVRELEDNRISAGTATYYLFVDTGNGIGPMVYGAIIGYVGGYSAGFGLCALAAFCILVAFFFVYRKKYEPDEKDYLAK